MLGGIVLDNGVHDGHLHLTTSSRLLGESGLASRAGVLLQSLPVLISHEFGQGFLKACVHNFCTLTWNGRNVHALFAQALKDGRLYREWPFAHSTGETNESGEAQWVKGTIDVILELDGRLHIFDYKTGHEEAKHYAGQMELYHAAVKAAAPPSTEVEAPVPETPITFATIPELAPVKIEKITVRERIVLENVLFDLDKAELKPEGKSRAAEAAGYLKEYRTDRVVVEGHACALGTEEHNLDLGMRRADAVKRYLVETGIEPERIRAISYGESQPISDNSTEEGRELNRRVVMEIVEGR